MICIDYDFKLRGSEVATRKAEVAEKSRKERNIQTGDLDSGIKPAD